jgi:LysM repeat protein
MNNQTPLVPQGIIDPKNKGRARVKIAVFFVLAVHGIGLLALLLQGCHREDANAQAAQSTTNALPTLDATNAPALADTSTTATPTNVAPPVVEQTNVAPVAMASEYLIAKGDTYATIARKFGVTIKAIADANPGLEPTKLRIGQKLHIPAATKTVASAPAATSGSTAPAGAEAYVVKSGDTLSRIASEHHVSVRSIRTANNLRSDRIVVGQKLKIPVKASIAAATDTASVPPMVAADTSPAH